MNPFKSYTYTWWQIGIFKLALLSIGALIGSYWSEVVRSYWALFIIIAIGSSAYTMYASFR
jgi:hypothetical protein